MIKNFVKPFLILTKKNLKRLIFIFLLMIISIFFDVLSIGILLPLFSEILNGSQNLNFIKFSFIENFLNSNNSLLILCALVFILFLLKNIFTFFYIKISTNYLAYLTIYHQDVILRNFIKQDYLKFSKKNSANYLREFTSEITMLNLNFIQPILTILLSILTLVGFSILSLNINFKITIFVLIFSIFFVTIFSVFLRQKFIFFGQQRRDLQYKLIKNLKHIFEGIRELKINSKEYIFLKNIKKIFNRQANTSVSRTVIGNLSKIILELILVSIFLSSLLLIKNINEYLPILGVYMASMMRIIPTINLLIRSYQRLNYSRSSLNNLINVFNEPDNQINNYQYGQSNIEFNQRILLKNVSFGYDHEDEILSNANLIINKNSIIGIKGKSGVGKSTFIDILVGLIEPKKGDIFIDDIKLNKDNSKLWTKKFSYIQQNIYTFNESIEVNISLETDIKKINLKKIQKVLSLVNLSEFNKKYNIKSNNEIGDSSSNISGGQAQRLAIARALYKNPEIIIFDESFNNIDQENRSDLLKIIKEISKNTTIIIISHEDSVFKLCNEIYEIKNRKFNKIKI